MPFVSESQRKWMYANHPEMAARWQAHTPKGEKLPEHVSKVKKAFWSGFKDEIQKLAEEEENSFTDRLRRVVGYGVPTGAVSLLSANPVASLVGRIPRPDKDVPSLGRKKYKDLKKAMGISERIPWYRSTDDTFTLGTGSVQDIKGLGLPGYTEKAMKHLGEDPRPKIYSRGSPGVVAHELGHAAGYFKNPKLFDLLATLYPIARKAGAPIGALMASAGDEGSAVVKAAPAVTALAFTPELLSEAAASYRAMKGLRSLGIYSPEELRRLSLSRLRSFGTYALPAAAMTLPIGILSLLRSRSSSEKLNDGVSLDQKS